MKQNNFSYAIREVSLVVVFYLVFVNLALLLSFESVWVEVAIAIVLTFIARFALYMYEKED